MLKKILCGLFLLSSLAMAKPPNLLTFGVGAFGSRERALFSIEYRGSLDDIWAVRPQIGFLVSEFNSYYFYLGVAYDFVIKNKIAITPNFSPGFYFHTRNGKKLGHPVEFRSSIDVSYIFDNGVRLGGQLFHISNGSLSRKNPGVNAIEVFLSFPLGCF